MDHSVGIAPAGMAQTPPDRRAAVRRKAAIVTAMPDAGNGEPASVQAGPAPAPGGTPAALGFYAISWVQGS